MKKSLLLSNSRNGVAALLTVVIVGAAALIMAFSASLLGVGELELGYTATQGGKTLSIAEACVEEALQQLRLDENYNGGSLSLGDGSCIMDVAGSGSDRTVHVSSTVDIYHKKIDVDLTLLGSSIVINSWEEVGE